MDNRIYFGSEIKLNVSIDAIGQYHMKDYDFECEFYCFSNKKIVLKKEAMIMQDDDNYLAVLDSKILGKGMLKCKITAYIPDGDLNSDDNDGKRTEVLIIDTGIQIMGA